MYKPFVALNYELLANLPILLQNIITTNFRAQELEQSLLVHKKMIS